MQDPLLLTPVETLQQILQPYTARSGLNTLHLHLHEILLAALFYTLLLNVVSPYASSRLFGRFYHSFDARTRLNWDVHVVSLCQSLIVCGAAFWTMSGDDERTQMGMETGLDGAVLRVWGYTGAGGMIQGMATGYFLWDLGICLRYHKIFGTGLLVHALAALIVFGFGFVCRPFVNYYCPIFILYELSSPFLNVHWFMDKLQMTGSRAQWYNGICLLASFLGCRLVWGTYQSYRVYRDVWLCNQHDTYLKLRPPNLLVLEPMRYAGEMSLPVWLAAAYLLSNITLNALNFYWFNKMIKTVRSRFTGPPGKMKSI